MTFKDLQKFVDSESGGTTGEANQILLQKLRGKPFWEWGKKEHRQMDVTHNGNCCMNHIIGLPKKNGIEYPLFDYQRMLLEALLIPGQYNSDPKLPSVDPNNIMYPFKEKHLWIKKSTGLGVTEFMLRFMAWLCLKDDDYHDSQMVIVTGPNQELAIKLIKRMKGLFTEKLGVTFDSKETVLNLNGCEISAYPSNHIDAFRSLTNPKFILLDEADYHRKNEQEEVRTVAERYIAKSDPFIVMCSTPNNPGGLFHRIEKEPFNTCIYKKFFLDYLWGLGKIYTKEEIEKAKCSPSFPREYQLEYLGTSGNCFSPHSIDRAIELGRRSKGGINKQAKHSLGCDPGFGSSCFGLVCLEYSDGIIKVVYADEFERTSFNSMVQKIWEIRNLVGTLTNVYIDGANSEFVEAIKQELGENADWNYIHDKISWCKKHGLDISDYMQVVPVSFAQEGTSMLVHCKNLLEHEDNLIAINPKWEKVIIALRSCTVQEYKMDKEQSSYSDIMDAYRLAMKFFSLNKE